MALVNQETKPEPKQNDISMLKGHGDAVHAHLVCTPSLQHQFTEFHIDCACSI